MLTGPLLSCMRSWRSVMGRKVGFKRSDRRYQSDDGQLWDSRFEWVVYDGLLRSGYNLRRCNEDDSITYHTSIPKGKCVECGGNEVLQGRVYTPDLFVVGSKGKGSIAQAGYFVECKGYFPADKRTLFRAVANQASGIDLRIVFQREVILKGTKVTNVDYIKKFCKTTPVGVWDPNTEDINWK